MYNVYFSGGSSGCSVKEPYMVPYDSQLLEVDLKQYDDLMVLLQRCKLQFIEALLRLNVKTPLVPWSIESGREAMVRLHSRFREWYIVGRRL